MYHRRTAVFLLSSGIFKTHEERPGRLVEFTLCHVVACRPIRRFSPVKVCYRPFSQITRSYFRVSFPYMHHPLRLTREPGTGYFYPELFSKSFWHFFPCVNMSYFVFIGIDLVLKGRLKLREKGTKQISYERCVCVNRLKCFIRIEMMITHRTDWGQNPPVSNLAGTSLQIKK